MSEPDTGAELEGFRRASRALVDGVADHLAALPSRPVWQPLPDALRARLLDLPLPERAATLDGLVATVLRDLLPHAIGNGHPPSSAGSTRRRARPPATTPTSTSSAWWSAGWPSSSASPTRRAAACSRAAGSAATIVCLAGARGRALGAVGHDVRPNGLVGAPRLVAYVPAEAHSCVRRALELLGLGSGLRLLSPVVLVAKWITVSDSARRALHPY